METSITVRRRRDIFLLLFTIAGMLFLVGRGIFIMLTGFVSLTSYVRTIPSFGWLSSISIFYCALLLIPLLIYCIRRLKGDEIPHARVRPIKPFQLITIILIWVLMIFVGSVFSESFQYRNFIVIPAFLIGISVPIAGLSWIAIGGLPMGSRRRLWAAFGIGMAGSTFVAMILEYLLVGVAVIIGGILAAMDPQLQLALQQIMNQVTSGGDIQNILTNLAPYLTNPLVLILALLFAAVLAPIIEETLKPLAVWLLGKRLHSPAEGFALGALCGAGFAMLEGMQAAGGMSQMIGVGIAARAASSLMHITASGVMGWGIASVKLEKRYGRLALASLFSICLHGLWNGSVVFAAFGALKMSLAGSQINFLGPLLVTTGMGILLLLLIFVVILLPLINHQFIVKNQLSEDASHDDIIAQL